ncbi:MAG: acyltransferase [Pseudomonadota bacterium]
MMNRTDSAPGDAPAGGRAPQPDSANAGRDAAIDFLRAAGILYIVGYWHLVPYTQSFPGYGNIYTEFLKDIALGSFVFCSGVLLARRPLAPSWSALAAFYRRRVLRIYPLYVIALLLFGVAGLASQAVVLNALLLMSMFLPPAPYTLWFVCMIMTFYLLTPPLLWLAEYPYALLLAGSTLLALGSAWHLAVHPLDTRLLQYLPCFLAGIAWTRMPALAGACARRSVLVLGVLVAAFLWYRVLYGQGLEAALGRIPAILAGTVLLYQSSVRQAGYLRARWLTHLAYASFCIYLFHRPVFHYLIGLHFPEDAWLRLAWLLGVALPLTVVLAYAVQTSYDRLLGYLQPARTPAGP